jgi:hypothetical protein
LETGALISVPTNLCAYKHNVGDGYYDGKKREKWLMKLKQMGISGAD